MTRGIKAIETLYRGYRFRSRLEARWAVFFDVAKIKWRYEPEGFDLAKVRTPRESANIDAYSPLWYLPDFYLPKQDCWIEVKPEYPSPREIFLMRRLVMGTRKNGHILWDLRTPDEILKDTQDKPGISPHFEGITSVLYSEVPLAWYHRIPGRLKMLDPNFRDNDPYPLVHVGGLDQWCECPRCGFVGIALYGDATGLDCRCLKVVDDDSFMQAEIRGDKVLLGELWDKLLKEPSVYTYNSPRLIGAYMAARQARFERKMLPNNIRSPLREALNQERQLVDVLQTKLDRIREVLDSDETERAD